MLLYKVSEFLLSVDDEVVGSREEHFEEVEIIIKCPLVGIQLVSPNIVQGSDVGDYWSLLFGLCLPRLPEEDHPSSQPQQQHLYKPKYKSDKAVVLTGQS